MRELLPEIVVQGAHFLRQHRHRRVVAHGADRLALVFREHADDLIAFFGRDVVHLLEQRQGIAIEGFRRQPRIDEIGLQIPHPLLQPYLVGMPALQQIVDAFGVHELGCLQIQRQHLAGPELALLDHILRLIVPDARFRSDGDVSILGDDPARGTQPIAVQGAAGVAAVGQHDAGWAVPRLHVRGVVLIESLQVGVDHVDRLPCRGHQHAHGVHGVETADQQQLEHIVERLRIRSRQGHDGQDIGQIRQHRRTKQRPARHRPAAVALHGVDLPVVGQVAVGMRQAPLRQGVGGKALMEHHHRRLHPRILQVGIELRQELRHHHALVDNGAGRQRRDIENRIAGLQSFFGAAARQIQFAVEGGLVEIAARIDEELLDGRQGLERLRAARLGCDRQGTEAGDLQLLDLQLLGQNRARVCGEARIPIEEYQTGGEQRCQREPGFRRGRPQKGGRLLDQQTTAIPGLAVRGDCTAMGQAIEGADGRLHHPMTGLIVQTRDQAESAGVLFIRRTAKAPIPNTRVSPAEAGRELRNVPIRHILRPCLTLPLQRTAEPLKNNNLNRFLALEKSTARSGQTPLGAPVYATDNT